MAQIQDLIDQDARSSVMDYLWKLGGIVGNDSILFSLSVEGIDLLAAIQRAIRIVTPTEKDWDTMEQQLRDEFKNSTFSTVLCNRLRSERDRLTKEFYEKVMRRQ